MATDPRLDPHVDTETGEREHDLDDDAVGAAGQKEMASEVSRGAVREIG